MSSPQKENGFAPIANEILEALAGFRLPGEQVQILFVIIRETYGFNRKEAEISYKRFGALTGLKKSNISRALKGLLSKLLIEVIKNDNRTVATYRFNKNYDIWQVIKTDNQTRLSKLITSVIKTDNLTIKETIKETIYTSSFLTFWNSYPKKVGKGAAFNSWKRIKKNDGLLENILSAIETQKKSDQWKRDNGQYIPHPATWLNQRRWEDEAVAINQPKREYVTI